MKVLITGAEGMLGHDITRVLKDKHQLIPTTLADLDICDSYKTAELLAFQAPDCVINCAAYTNVDGCETDADAAFAANADGVKNLAFACRQSGAKLIHVSTDYVFDGTGQSPYVEDNTVNPLSVYGQSKLAGERFVQEIFDNYAIIRTEWLYGRNGKHFVGKIMELAGERDTIEVVDDQTGTPTCTADLALAIEALLAVPARGIYHVTNAGSCSWYVFAKKILAIAGSQTRVLPISSERLARPARRPAYSVLNCSKFMKETGHVLLPWEQALKSYMKA